MIALQRLAQKIVEFDLTKEAAEHMQNSPVYIRRWARE